jgi:preprotein translocase subunit SecG
MLSFLREQTGIGSAATKASAPAAGTDPSEQEYLTVSSRNRQTRKSTIILAALFGVGALCLFVMIKKSTPDTAAAADNDAEEARIESAISQITGVRSEMYERMDEIVGKFNEFSDVKQVGVDELAKNPFEHQMFSSEMPKKADNENQGAMAELLRQQQLWQQSREMQLLTIMQSENGNCCMIDDKILYKGDTIRDFIVTNIGENSVKLESNGVQVELKLAQ